MRTTRCAAAVLTAVGLLTGCGHGLLSPSESRELAAAEARWKAQALTAYLFEYRESCFCPPAETQWMRITVRDGAVRQVVYADSSDVAHPRPAQWPTIDLLFTRLQRVEQESNEALEDIVASFDTAIGYPKSVSFKPKPTVVDGGSSYEVRRVEPLAETLRASARPSTSR